MNLIRELRDGAVSDATPLSTLLRKALVLASLIKNDSLRLWAKRELDGYTDVENLPEYRSVTAIVAGDFVGHVRAGDHRLPVEQYDDDIQKRLTVVPIVDGVRELEETVKAAGEFVTFALEMSWCQLLPPLFEDTQLVDIRRHVHTGRLQAILDTVRTRLLELVLDLEREFPEVIRGDEAIAAIDRAAAASIVNVHVLGNGNVIAAGSDVVQHATLNFQAADLSGMMHALESAHVEHTDRESLKRALEADGPIQGKKLGKRVAGWLGSMTSKLLEGTVTSVPAVLTKIVLHYYGLS
jgi:AbiTii